MQMKLATPEEMAFVTLFLVGVFIGLMAPHPIWDFTVRWYKDLNGEL